MSLTSDVCAQVQQREGLCSPFVSFLSPLCGSERHLLVHPTLLLSLATLADHIEHVTLMSNLIPQHQLIEMSSNVGVGCIVVTVTPPHGFSGMLARLGRSAASPSHDWGDPR